MTNQNKYMRAFMKICIQFFSHGTQEQRNGVETALKPWSKNEPKLLLFFLDS